jgi:uncharacterized protein (TIGR02246 family)
MRWIAVVIASIGLIAAPALAQDKSTIEKLNDAWTAAFNKGDAAAVAALYTDDAYVLPPGADMVKGRSAIESFWRQAAQQMGDAKLTTIDVLPLGRTAAREIGTVTLKTKSQPRKKSPVNTPSSGARSAANGGSRPIFGTPTNKIEISRIA